MPFSCQILEALNFPYIEQLKVHMECYFLQDLCNNENFSLSYNPPPVQLFQMIYLVNTNQIHLVGAFIGSHGYPSW